MCPSTPPEAIINSNPTFAIGNQEWEQKRAQVFTGCRPKRFSKLYRRRDSLPERIFFFRGRSMVAEVTI